MSFFNDVEMLPEDPVFGLPILFKADSRPYKVDLGVGTYEDSEGKPFLLTSVREVDLLLAKQGHSKEYLPIAGHPGFIEESLKLIFGETHKALVEERIFGAQAVGGTSALRIAADFLAELKVPVVYISDPTWPNHRPLFQRAGLAVKTYPYYDVHTKTLDFDGFCESIKHMPAGSAILLQTCCHNPTGMDLKEGQWQELSSLIQTQGLIPLFDFAYQGFGKGLQEDAGPIRLFVDQGHEMLVSSSNSKNFGIYGERAGCVAIVSSNKAVSQKVGSHIKASIRTSYSNPPMHPARLVATILQTPALKTAWQHEVTAMRERVDSMREALAFGLMSKADHHDFGYILNQRGLFSYSGFTKPQVLRLREEKGVYLLDNGRINLAGINPHNLEYVVDAFLNILERPSEKA